MQHQLINVYKLCHLEPYLEHLRAHIQGSWDRGLKLARKKAIENFINMDNSSTAHDGLPLLLSDVSGVHEDLLDLQTFLNQATDNEDNGHMDAEGNFTPIHIEPGKVSHLWEYLKFYHYDLVNWVTNAE